jgi:hypothetical protein
MYTDEVIKKKQGKKSKWSCIIFVDFVKSMTRVLVDNLCVRIIKLRMDNLVSNSSIFFCFNVIDMYQLDCWVLLCINYEFLIYLT